MEVRKNHSLKSVYDNSLDFEGMSCFSHIVTNSPVFFRSVFDSLKFNDWK